VHSTPPGAAIVVAIRNINPGRVRPAPVAGYFLPMVFADRALAQRLERAEGSVGVGFAETRQRLAPAHGAEWRDIGGATVVFDGADSPTTQTFGLGMTEPATEATLDAIEAFFRDRQAATHHEVSPLAGVATTALLVARGYQPIEMSSVLVRDLTDVEERTHEKLVCRTLTHGERAAWVEASVAGWSETPEVAEMMRGFASVAVENPALVNFAVVGDGMFVASGSLGIVDDVALLAGASTVRAARGQGAQSLLFSTRLVEAKRRGCRVAMMAAEPGSTSQRNAERSGFRIAYTRTKWRLAG